MATEGSQPLCWNSSGICTRPGPVALLSSSAIPPVSVMTFPPKYFSSPSGTAPTEETTAPSPMAELNESSSRGSPSESTGRGVRRARVVCAVCRGTAYAFWRAWWEGAWQAVGVGCGDGIEVNRRTALEDAGGEGSVGRQVSENDRGDRNGGQF